MSYPEAIRYLESFVNYEKFSNYKYHESIKLERIRNFLRLVDNPQDSLRCIHVAGSKGKGSTSAFLAYILREAGFKVGLYTSPHLSDFRERIRILNPAKKRLVYPDVFEGMISKLRLAKLIAKIKPLLEKYNRTSVYGAISFFEAYTALAFIYFKEEKVDFVVLETGLGGRLDATNIVLPFVCAITPISYEHTDKLGRTLKAIATEKAGIIKENVPVVSAPQKEEAKKVIVNKCLEKNAKLILVGRDVKIIEKEDCFDVLGLKREYRNKKIKLKGKHQFINATVALAMVEVLQGYGFKININAIDRGLRNTLWPGRCEVLSKSPYIVLDGAQNAASCRVLVNAIRDSFKYRRVIIVFGASNDKDIKGMADELSNLAKIIILTRSSNPRATDPLVLAKYFRNKEKYITNSIKEAQRWLKKNTQKGDLILVTGSLFVVGEFRDDKKRFN